MRGAPTVNVKFVRNKSPLTKYVTLDNLHLAYDVATAASRSASACY